MVVSKLSKDSIPICIKYWNRLLPPSVIHSSFSRDQMRAVCFKTLLVGNLCNTFQVFVILGNLCKYWEISADPSVCFSKLWSFCKFWSVCKYCTFFIFRKPVVSRFASFVLLVKLYGHVSIQECQTGYSQSQMPVNIKRIQLLNFKGLKKYRNLLYWETFLPCKHEWCIVVVCCWFIV